MAPPAYRCPICQAASKTFRSLLHHVQWWHGFCRDSSPTLEHRGGSGGTPNYDLVRKRDTYLREQGNLRAKICDFFHRTEANMKLDRAALSYQCAADTSPPHSRPREGPPAATFYQEFWPLAVPKEAQHPVHTTTDSSDVRPPGRVQATVQVSETRRHRSTGLRNDRENAYCSGTKGGSSQGDKAVERAMQTKARPKRLTGKPRVRFVLNASDPAPSKPAHLVGAHAASASRRGRTSRSKSRDRRQTRVSRHRRPCHTTSTPTTH